MGRTVATQSPEVSQLCANPLRVWIMPEKPLSHLFRGPLTVTRVLPRLPAQLSLSSVSGTLKVPPGWDTKRPELCWSLPSISQSRRNPFPYHPHTVHLQDDSHQGEQLLEMRQCSSSSLLNDTISKCNLSCRKISLW